jgi:3-keto-L-gulonate-6-phosphate decarboxylase
MKSEPRKTKIPKSLDERFSKHPETYEQMHRIADEMEQAIAGGMTADQAEEMAIQRINELGRALLTDWAKARQARAVAEVCQEKPETIRDSKKN